MKEKNNEMKSWLDNLQQESWQLELIISSILLLIITSFDDEIPRLVLKYHSTEGFNFAFIVAIIIPVLLFIKSNLIVHIFLRGLWIGCIGLRSISSDINYDTFSFADRFERFLKKKIVPFDDYIEKLERICSIIFSYSFLMVFHFLSFSIFLTLLQSLNYFGWEFFGNTIVEPILILIYLILVTSGILNFIDFITIGKLKKTKYLNAIFYPFYRIYNTFSFAFLYRPIHYNFITNKLGRRYMLLMLPYMFLLAFAGKSINFKEYIYVPKKENGSNWVIENNYENLRENTSIEHASIDKLFYNSEEPIKLFIKVDDNEKTNQLIKHLCPDITSYDRQPFTIRPFNAVKITANDAYHEQVSATEHKNKIESSISCISKIYEISIDSNPLQSLDYIFYQHQNSMEEGILTGINIENLEKGKHNLVIKIKTLDNDTLGIPKLIEIPFFAN